MNDDIAKKIVPYFIKILQDYNGPMREKKENGIFVVANYGVVIIHDTVSQVTIQKEREYNFYSRLPNLIKENFAYVDDNHVLFKSIKTDKLYTHCVNFLDTFKDDYFSLSTLIDNDVLDLIPVLIELKKEFSGKGYNSFTAYGIINEDFISKVQVALK